MYIDMSADQSITVDSRIQFDNSIIEKGSGTFNTSTNTFTA